MNANFFFFTTPISNIERANLYSFLSSATKSKGCFARDVSATRLPWNGCNLVVNRMKKEEEREIEEQSTFIAIK